MEAPGVSAAGEPARVATVDSGSNTLHISHGLSGSAFAWHPPTGSHLQSVIVLTADWFVAATDQSLWLVFYSLPTIIATCVWHHADPDATFWGQADPDVPSTFMCVADCCHFSGVLVLVDIGVLHASAMAPLFYSFDGRVCESNGVLLDATRSMPSFVDTPDPGLDVSASKDYHGPARRLGAQTIEIVVWRQRDAGVSGVFATTCGTVQSFAVGDSNAESRAAYAGATLTVCTMAVVRGAVTSIAVLEQASEASKVGEQLSICIGGETVTTLTAKAYGGGFLSERPAPPHAPVRTRQLPRSGDWQLCADGYTTSARLGHESIWIA